MGRGERRRKGPSRPGSRKAPAETRPEAPPRTEYKPKRGMRDLPPLRTCVSCSSAARGRTVTVTLADIESARRTIAGQVLRTPVLPAPKLSALTGADVFVKYENLQVTNSFKERGALNKLASLPAAAR